MGNVDFSKLSTDEQILFDVIMSARKTEEFLWGELNPQWNLEEWKRMFRKRNAKIEDIDINNPHAKIELKKRLLQNAALSVALLAILENGSTNENCTIETNLPQYSKPEEKKVS